MEKNKATPGLLLKKNNCLSILKQYVSQIMLKSRNNNNRRVIVSFNFNLANNKFMNRKSPEQLGVV